MAQGPVEVGAVGLFKSQMARVVQLVVFTRKSRVGMFGL